MKYLKYVLIGVILGLSNIMPGISGGTMAVVLNVYDKLVDAIDLNLEKFKKHFKFLLSVGIGCVVGIYGFSFVINYFFQNYPQGTNFFFIGVIFGSVPMVYKKALNGGSKIQSGSYVFFLIGIFAMVIMAFGGGGENSNIITTLTLKDAIYLCSVTFFAGFAMIIPGISGSFVSLMLGAYTTLTTAVENLNFMVLLPAAVGGAFGVLVGAKFIKKLIVKRPQETYMCILGLVIGSVFVIYPGFSLDIMGGISLVAMVVGGVVTYQLSKK